MCLPNRQSLCYHMENMNYLCAILAQHAIAHSLCPFFSKCLPDISQSFLICFSWKNISTSAEFFYMCICLFIDRYTHTLCSPQGGTLINLPCMVVGLSVKEIHYQDNALLYMLTKFLKSVFHYIYANITWLAHNLPNVSICQGYFQSLRKMCLCVF